MATPTVYVDAFGNVWTMNGFAVVVPGVQTYGDFQTLLVGTDVVHPPLTGSETPALLQAYDVAPYAAPMTVTTPTDAPWIVPANALTTGYGDPLVQNGGFYLVP